MSQALPCWTGCTVSCQPHASGPSLPAQPKRSQGLHLGHEGVRPVLHVHQEGKVDHKLQRGDVCGGGVWWGWGVGGVWVWGGVWGVGGGAVRQEAVGCSGGNMRQAHRQAGRQRGGRAGRQAGRADCCPAHQPSNPGYGAPWGLAPPAGAAIPFAQPRPLPSCLPAPSAR